MPRKPRSASNAAAAKKLASEDPPPAAAGAAKPSKAVPPEQMSLKELCNLLKSKGLPHSKASQPVLLRRLQKAPQTGKFCGYNLPPNSAKTAAKTAMPNLKTVAEQKSPQEMSVDDFLAKMAKTALVMPCVQMEICYTRNVMKYLFKYLHKGSPSAACFVHMGLN